MGAEQPQARTPPEGAAVSPASPSPASPFPVSELSGPELSGLGSVPASGVAAQPGATASARPYPQVLRSQNYRWWRPLVSLAVGVLLAGVVVVWFAVIHSMVEDIGGPATANALEEGPGGFAFGNVLIAMAIPVAMLAVATGFLRHPGWLASVELRMRWGWLARCTAVLTVWAVLATGMWIMIDGAPGTGGDDIALLIVLCLLTTPLQAAGEEYLVRGWLSQSIAAWFARPVPGAVVAGLFSATVFAFMHGSQNVWLFADRFAFGLVASYLVWRTGGLEAAIALHAVGNIGAIIPAILAGTLDETLLITEAPAGEVALDVVSMLVAAAVVVWLARRRRIRRLSAD